MADAVGQIGPAGPAERVGGTGDAAVVVDDPVTLGIDRAGRAIGADLVHDHAFGARDEVAARIVGHQAEAADVGVEGLADQHRKLAVPFVRPVALGRLGVRGDDQPLPVQRPALTHVTGAGAPALYTVHRK